MNFGTFLPTGVVRPRNRCAVADHRAVCPPPPAGGHTADRPDRARTAAAGEGTR